MVTQAALLNALPWRAALLDARGLILSVNESWAVGEPTERQWPAYGAVGQNYLALCETVGGAAAEPAQRAALGIRAVLDGAAAAFAFDYARDAEGGSCTHRLQVTSVSDIEPGALVMHIALEDQPGRSVEQVIGRDDIAIFGADGARAPMASDRQVLEISRDISDRKRIELELERQHRMLRTLIDALPDTIYTLDIDARFVVCNRATLQQFGADRERDLRGRTILELLPAAAAERAHAENLRVLAGQSVLDRDERQIDRAGVLQWVRTIKVPLRASNGEISGMVGIHRNITERKRAQEESRELVERLGNTLEGLSEGFCTLDRDWRFCYVNRQAERLFRRPRAELLGRTVWDCLPEVAGTPFDAALRQALDRDELVQIVECFPPRRRWFEVRIHPSRRGLAVYLRDVSRQLRLAAKLEAGRLQLVTAQAVAKIGSWSNDLGSGLVEWSDETHRIFETDPLHFHPTHPAFLELIDPDDRAAVEEAFALSLHQHSSQAVEHRLRLPSGAVKVVEERWQVYFDAEGAPVRALGTCQDITQRKHSEQKLRENEALLSLAGRLGRIGAWTVDLSTNSLTWSDEVCAIHGLPAGSTPSLAEAMAFYPPEWADICTRAFRSCAEQGVAYDVELEIDTADGRRVWVRTIGEAIRDQTGKVCRVQGAFQDLSERKVAEEESRRLAARLTNALESITDGFFTLDRDWRITYINREAELLLQRSRAELIGQIYWDAFPLEIGTDFECAYRSAMSKNDAVTFEALYAPLETWRRVNVYPSEEGLSIYFRDVTAERSSRQQLELLEASVAQLNDIVLITEASPLDDLGPRIVFVNEAFERSTGYSREEALGRTPRLLQGPLTDRAELDRVRTALEQFEPVHAELLNYTKSGEPYWVEMDIVPVGGKGSTPAHFVSIERDITERKRDHLALRELNSELEARVRNRTAELILARDAAEQANLAKSTFLAAMSHEIRTPMNGVVGMIDVLAQSRLQPDQQDTVRVARESALALLAIVDDVLDFSKIEAGQFKVDVEPMNVEAVVEGVCETLATVANKKGVRISLFIDPDLPAQVRGDAVRLRQVLLNLIGNAIKFSSVPGHAGHVSLRAMQVDSAPAQTVLELEVADNGIGMDNAMLARLFKPFSQVAGGPAIHFGGTGLGLSISHALVEIMGGRIEVHSEIGRGATFTVRLPLDAVAGPMEPLASHELAGIRCIVVGDVSEVDDVRVYLARSGASAQAMPDVAAAGEALRDDLLGPCVVVVTGSKARPETLAELRRASKLRSTSAVRYVVLAGGPGQTLPAPQEDTVHLSPGILYRRDLIDAVALAAGRTTRLAETVTPTQPPLVTATSRARASASGRLILVAEDNETNQLVLRKQLALLGFAADMGRDGHEVLALLKRREYPLLLTDLQMPGMDGYELAAAIRASEPAGRRMPVVALTANALKSETARCIDVGMDTCLIKPVPLAVLEATLSRYLPDAGEHFVPDGLRNDGWVDNAAQPADLSVLTDLIGDDPAAIDEVLTAFRIGAALVHTDLNHGVRTGSLQLASDAAHKLKSGARAIGAIQLAELCANIEASAVAGHAESVAMLLPQFEAELSAVLAYLDSARAGGP